MAHGVLPLSLWLAHNLQQYPTGFVFLFFILLPKNPTALLCGSD
jgi:hypothetical protein